MPRAQDWLQLALLELAHVAAQEFECRGARWRGSTRLSLRRSSASWRRREKGERSRIDVPNERIHFLLGERQVLEMPQGVDGAHEAHDCDEGARVVHIVRIRQVVTRT